MDAVTVTAGLFGCSEEVAEELCDILDGLCGAAYEAAEILFSPYDGVHPDAGTLTVGEAVDRVLTEIADAAPGYPAWSTANATFDGIAVFMLNMAVTEVIEGALLCVEALGWVGDIDGSTDESFAPAVEAGQRVLGIVREARGIMADGAEC